MRKSTTYPFFILIGAIAIGLAVLFLFVEIDAEGGDVSMANDVKPKEMAPRIIPNDREELSPAPVPMKEMELSVQPVPSVGNSREVLAALVAEEPEEAEPIPEPEPIIPGPYDGWTQPDHVSERTRARDAARAKLEAVLNED
jgi:hypothetical protein